MVLPGDNLRDVVMLRELGADWGIAVDTSAVAQLAVAAGAPGVEFAVACDCQRVQFAACEVLDSVVSAITRGGLWEGYSNESLVF